MPEGAEECLRVQQNARGCSRTPESAEGRHKVQLGGLRCNWTPEGAVGRQKVQLDAGRCSRISKVSRIDLSLKYQVVKILG